MSEQKPEPPPPRSLEEAWPTMTPEQQQRFLTAWHDRDVQPYLNLYGKS